jgi:type III secretion system YscQ/HrcQ family protein
MVLREFPYASWPRLARGEAVTLRLLARALPLELDRRVAREGQTLLGATVEVRSLPFTLCSAETTRTMLPAPLLAVALEYCVGPSRLPLICELPPELGAACADRTLGGDGHAVALPGESVDAVTAGVLGYLCARLLAVGGAALRLSAVLTESVPVHALLGSGQVLVWPLQVLLDGHGAGLLRVLIPEGTARELSLHGGSSASPMPLLRTLPVTLCALAAQFSLPRSAIVALGVGDIVIPERCSLTNTADGWHGEASLHLLGVHRSVFGCSARAAELVIIDRGPSQGASTVTDAKRIETEALHIGADPLALAGDAPIELCLELARFRLTLAELSALRPGEVLSTGRTIGDRVTLSANGQAIAHGELVDIDGEVGLRVLERVG